MPQHQRHPLCLPLYHLPLAQVPSHLRRKERNSTGNSQSKVRILRRSGRTSESTSEGISRTACVLLRHSQPQNRNVIRVLYLSIDDYQCTCRCTIQGAEGRVHTCCSCALADSPTRIDTSCAASSVVAIACMKYMP